jgi:hypothetical protein
MTLHWDVIGATLLGYVLLMLAGVVSWRVGLRLTRLADGRDDFRGPKELHFLSVIVGFGAIAGGVSAFVLLVMACHTVGTWALRVLR